MRSGGRQRSFCVNLWLVLVTDGGATALQLIGQHIAWQFNARSERDFFLSLTRRW